MRLEDFDYELPKELIAQTPSLKRDECRLMVLDRAKNTIEHRHFYDILEYLHEGDCLVVNDSRVIPELPSNHLRQDSRLHAGTLEYRRNVYALSYS